MYAFECMLAVSLLTAPEGAIDLKHPPACYATLQPSLQQLAIQWELLDPREGRYVLTRAEDFATDVTMLRKRYRNLREAPRLEEAQRFPDRNLVNDLLTFNRTYRQFLTERQPVDLLHADELQAAVQETDRLYQIWDAVRDARCTYYYTSVRRQALKQLRDLIGMEAFYQGALPPHVPVWRFPEMD